MLYDDSCLNLPVMMINLSTAFLSSDDFVKGNDHNRDPQMSLRDSAQNQNQLNSTLAQRTTGLNAQRTKYFKTTTNQKQEPSIKQEQSCSALIICFADTWPALSLLIIIIRP